MGDRTADRHPMAWQSTLAEMKVHGALLAQTAACACRGNWIALDLDKLIAERGPDWMPWDGRPPCVRCGQPGHYMASPGEGTPYRPLRTSIHTEARRQAFLRGFGFSRRDIVRIKALAEATTGNRIPAALNDLDVPYRVGAVMPQARQFSNGEDLGEWAGRSLLYWEMHPAERAVWARRSKGPRGV